MVKPYSEDLRARVIAAVVQDDLSCREAARRSRVSASSAVVDDRAGCGRSRWEVIVDRSSNHSGIGYLS